MKETLSSGLYWWRVRLLRLLALVMICSLAAGAGTASTYKRAKDYTQSNFETISDDFYLYAERATLGGITEGDLTVFAYKAVLNGEVSQSANLAGRFIEQNGKVDGSVRVFAEGMSASGFVGRSEVVFARVAHIAKAANIERDLTVYGNDITIEGTVKGNLIAKGEVVELSGVVAGDATLEGNRIRIVPPAVIVGNLTYTSKTEAVIDREHGVTISGTVTRKEPEKKEETSHGYTGLVLRISSLFAAFLFGIIVIWLFRPYAEESFAQLRGRFSVSLAAGLVGLGALVLCVIVLLFAVALMVVGLILTGSGLAPFGSVVLIFSILMIPLTGFLSVAGTVMFYSGKIVVALWLGYLILSRVRQRAAPLGKATLFLGLVILFLLFLVPFLGSVIYIFASIIGAGAIILGIKYSRRVLPSATVSVAQNPPPPVPPSPFASGTA